MNADWDVLVGPDEPVIVAPWEGFTDLRLHPEAAHTLPETAAHPELAEALLALNKSGSPVFTSKCDVWPLAPEDIDPYEFDATPEETTHGIACYIDVIPVDPNQRATFAAAENLARAIVHKLRRDQNTTPGRIDLVVRPAEIDGASGYALTLYASAIGASDSAARKCWKTVLSAVILATIESTLSPESGQATHTRE